MCSKAMSGPRPSRMSSLSASTSFETDRSSEIGVCVPSQREYRNTFISSSVPNAGRRLLLVQAARQVKTFEREFQSGRSKRGRLFFHPEPLHQRRRSANVADLLQKVGRRH